MARRISSPVTIGRTEELERLRAAMARGTDQGTQTVVLAGEAGVGKTRLIGDIAKAITDDGAEVVVGRCTALVDTAMPYAPVVSALDALLRAVEPSEVDALLRGIGPDLARILPWLTGALADAVPVPVPETMVPGRVFDATRTLLQRRASRRPVLLVFEDLHWADPASLDLIAYLVRTGGWPGLIVLTYRSDELHRRHPLLPWLAELARVSSVDRIELDRLDAGSITAQAEAILGHAPDAQLLDELVRRGGGNAFMTEELLASLQADGRLSRATGIAQVLIARVDLLPDDTRHVVDVVSLSGAPVDLASIAGVLGVGEDEVEGPVHAALDAQVLVPASDRSGYAFRHALLQEAVYDALLPSERRRMHLAFARRLVAQVDRRTAMAGARWAAIAQHALAADDLALGLRASIEAGRAASSAGAFIDAARHLERAVELYDAVPDAAAELEDDRSTLFALAARAVAFTGDPARALRLWEQALEATGPDTPVEARVHILLGLASDANDVFQGGRALDATRSAVEAMAGQPASSLHARALSDYGRELGTYADMFEPSVQAELAAIEMAREVGDPRTEAVSRSRLALDLMRNGDHAAALEEFDAAMAVVRATRDRYIVLNVYSNVGFALDEMGDPGRAGRIFADEAIPMALDLGLPTFALSSFGAWYLWQAGDWAGGRKLLDGIIQDGRMLSGRQQNVWLTRDLYDVVMGLPRQERMLDHATAYPDDPAPLLIDAEAAIWAGDAEKVFALAPRMLELGARTGDNGDRSFRGWTLRLLARAEADLAARARAGRRPTDADGSAARARQAATDARALLVGGLQGDLYGGVMPGDVALAEAEATRAEGNSDPGAWTTAIDEWERLGRVFEPAYARSRRAEALLASGGSRTKATDDLRRAAAAARELGARPLLDLVEALASRSRIRVDASPVAVARTDGPLGDLPAPLTPRELEVLTLLADGRSNRQIAEALFISESTAGVHVSNILGKLGVSGRTEAAAVAFRSGLVAADPANKTA